MQAHMLPHCCSKWFSETIVCLWFSECVNRERYLHATIERNIMASQIIDYKYVLLDKSGSISYCYYLIAVLTYAKNSCFCKVVVDLEAWEF